ncbi:hypothetical protein SR41_06150 [Sphingomonas melonis]|uniref:Uncharacterized protein n=1 Tax=Sphingomonas melonis TaxID=152682 RepID=A0A0D1KXJ9_9SPHN|nr:hypothetical protein SR41_06150 [Sphingomonas melonis]
MINKVGRGRPILSNFTFVSVNHRFKYVEFFGVCALQVADNIAKIAFKLTRKLDICAVERCKGYLVRPL